MNATEGALASRTPGGWRVGPWTPWAWALGAAGWHVAAAVVTLPLVGVLPREVGMALQPGLWGLLSLAGVLVIGRALFGRWLTRPAWGWIVPAVGFVVAGGLQLALFAWSVARFGAFDTEYVGPTAALAALAVGSAVACLAALVAPLRATWPPALVAALCAIGSGVVVVLNSGGLANGLGSDSVALALLVAAAGGFTLAAAFVAVVVAIRREVPMD